MADALTIRTMTRDELNIAVDWAAAEGWNPGLHDADAFYAADPGGFLMGLINDKPVGCISAVQYPDMFGFIGFYIVAPEFRGKGYGLQIWKRGMEQLKGRNIGLDGVVEQQPNYQKSGFELAYSNIRFEGRNLSIDHAPSHHTRIATTADFAKIIEYDRKCFPSQRDRFLSRWINMPDSTTFISDNTNAITGYGTIRACRSGHKVGPLFADDVLAAKTLLSSLCDTVKSDAPVYLDVPETNTDAMRLAQILGMTQVFGTARMYTEKSPNISLKNVFGVTSFELG